MDFREVFESCRGFVTFYSKAQILITLPAPYNNFQRLIRHCKQSTNFLMALLGKGKAARILDKTHDSGAVVKLFEQLRQVILVYQVGTLNHRLRLG